MKTVRESLVVVITGLSSLTAFADNTPQQLPFVQNWADTALITKDNDWSGCPGFMGYRGDKLTSKPGTNPQTIVADGTNTPLSVNANQRKPDTLKQAGVAEFDGLTNPVVAIKGSATASAPFLLLNLDTRGKQNVALGYNLRDIDGSANDTVQSIAFQFRVGTNDNFTDIPSAYVADATSGPNQATLVTRGIVLLPTAANDQPVVQVRWITANAESNDEWIGIDDITVIGDPLSAPKIASESPANATNRTTKVLRSPRDAETP